MQPLQELQGKKGLWAALSHGHSTTGGQDRWARPTSEPEGWWVAVFISAERGSSFLTQEGWEGFPAGDQHCPFPDKYISNFYFGIFLNLIYCWGKLLKTCSGFLCLHPWATRIHTLILYNTFACLGSEALDAWSFLSRGFCGFLYKSTMLPALASNSWPSCLSLLSPGVTGICHHT